MSDNRTVEQRFWAFVEKTDTCWLWRGNIHSDTGYGAFAVRYKGFLAHRMSYILTHGSIPDGLLVLHKCDVRACVNPDHLFVGTQRDNVMDAIKKGRFHPPDISRWQRRGEGINTAKLTEVQVREIREKYIPRKVPCSKLAQEYGVHMSQITRIIKRESWKHVA